MQKQLGNSELSMNTLLHCAITILFRQLFKDPYSHFNQYLLKGRKKFHSQLLYSYLHDYLWWLFLLFLFFSFLIFFLNFFCNSDYLKKKKKFNNGLSAEASENCVPEHIWLYLNRFLFSLDVPRVD